MKGELSQEKLNSLILEMLINIMIEQRALRNMLATEYVSHTKENIEELNYVFQDLASKSRHDIMQHLKEKYGFDDGVDSLLNSIT